MRSQRDCLALPPNHPGLPKRSAAHAGAARPGHFDPEVQVQGIKNAPSRRVCSEPARQTKDIRRSAARRRSSPPRPTWFVLPPPPANRDFEARLCNLVEVKETKCPGSHREIGVGEKLDCCQELVCPLSGPCRRFGLRLFQQHGIRISPVGGHGFGDVWGDDTVSWVYYRSLCVAAPGRAPGRSRARACLSIFCHS